MTRVADVEQERFDGPAASRRIAELVASRSRLAAAADDARRRLHGDLHEGPQQRLAHTVIALKILRDTGTLGSAETALVHEALNQAQQASRDLRDVVRRTLPGTLLHGGLQIGLTSFAADLPVPVEVTVEAPRLPIDVETTAYLVAVEALTDAVQRRRAQRVDVDVRLDDDILVIEVGDDAVAGADGAGAGLTGLLDRVDVAAGSLTVTRPPGGGTMVCARLPVGSRT